MLKKIEYGIHKEDIYIYIYIYIIYMYTFWSIYRSTNWVYQEYMLVHLSHSRIPGSAASVGPPAATVCCSSRCLHDAVWDTG